MKQKLSNVFYQAALGSPLGELAAAAGFGSLITGADFWVKRPRLRLSPDPFERPIHVHCSRVELKA